MKAVLILSVSWALCSAASTNDLIDLSWYTGSVELVEVDGMACFSRLDAWELYKAYKVTPTLARLVNLQEEQVQDLQKKCDATAELLALEKRKKTRIAIIATLSGILAGILIS